MDMNMKNFIIYLFTIAIVSCSQASEYDLVIKNVGLFNGEEDLGIVNVAINSDTIAAISTEALLSDSTIDGSGKYVIPGMVNAHVHISNLEDIQAGYDLGILTLLNMHTGLEEREQEWKQNSRDNVGFSSLYGAGHAATVPGGHPNQYSPDMETIGDSISVEKWVDNRIAANVDYIKIVRDHHEWMGNPALPTLSYEQIKQIITYAKGRDYKSVVHANTIEEMVRIAEFKPDGFVHMPDYKEDYPIQETFYKIIAESGAFVVTTGGISLKPMDDAPPFVREWITNNLLDANQRTEIIKKLHEHGVLLIVGTDAQAGQMNFESDYFYELELYKMAGMSNSEILKAATGNAARAFNLPIGEIEIGSKANMVLLNGNPIVDLENLKKVEQVWKNGKTNY
jgi:imidazolonepropionase-like amidohydrolase